MRLIYTKTLKNEQEKNGNICLSSDINAVWIRKFFPIVYIIVVANIHLRIRRRVYMPCICFIIISSCALLNSTFLIVGYFLHTVSVLYRLLHFIVSI